MFVSRHSSLSVSAVALCAAAAITLAVDDAAACGGFFCSAVQPTPVDQNAERILFEVHPPPAGVTAVVEISYTGDPDAFSWIVPVPETPTLDVVPNATLRVLDAATTPRVTAPPTTCNPPEPPPSFNPFPTQEFVAAEPDASPEPAVNVEDLPIVGAFDPEVISSDDPAALIDWLKDNDYLITEGMEPFVEQYVSEGYKFLGLKLAPDQGVTDISPIKFTCPNGDMPLVPIRLTSVSAEPEMGILTFIAADERYAPQNYRELTVSADDLQWDYNTGTSNYYTLVSHLVDEAGGKAFVTQSAGTTELLDDNALRATIANDDGGEEVQAARDYVVNLAANFGYLTRLYTRMGGWEMTDDPVFAPADLSDVDRVIDLSNREPVEICAEGVQRSRLRQPCGNTYCGVGGICALTDEGVEGCICPEGATARRIRSPVGAGRALRRTITCQDASLNLLPADEVGDVCANVSCGEGGSCIAVNGFPTCRCDDGYAARASGVASGARCIPVVETFDVSQLKFSNTGVPDPFAPVCKCTSTTSTTWASGFGALLLLGAAVRRRRR